ncbi:MAG TPA: NUDIX domain-containing protein, partial [Roseomonas sp.]|nr:NUDIX domain-containing protein [Roseomonas sp.]
AADLPRKSPKAARPLRHGAHFLLTDGQGRILLRRRPEKGLLGGMLEVPGTPWRAGTPWTEAEAIAHAPVAARWRTVPGTARHGFTHFELEMILFAAPLPRGAVPEGEWQPPEAARVAVPSVMRRLLDLAGAA